jgi:hypothetical protein
LELFVLVEFALIVCEVGPRWSTITELPTAPERESDAAPELEAELDSEAFTELLVFWLAVEVDWDPELEPDVDDESWAQAPKEAIRARTMRVCFMDSSIVKKKPCRAGSSAGPRR